MLSNILKISVVLSVTSVVLTGPSVHFSYDIFEADQSDNNFLPLGDNSYFLGQEDLSWFQAYLKCLSRGSLLVTPTHNMEPVKTFMADTNHSNTRWWSSGADLHEDNNFMWYSSGLELIPKQNFALQTNISRGNNCITLSFQESEPQLKVSSCDQKAYYICEAEKPAQAIEIVSV